MTKQQHVDEFRGVEDDGERWSGWRDDDDDAQNI